MKSIILIFLFATSTLCFPGSYNDIAQNWVDFGMNIAKQVVDQYGQANKIRKPVKSQPVVTYSVTIPATSSPVEYQLKAEVTTIVVTITEPAQALPASSTIAPPPVLPPQSFSGQPSIILIPLGPNQTPPPGYSASK